MAISRTFAGSYGRTFSTSFRSAQNVDLQRYGSLFLRFEHSSATIALKMAFPPGYGNAPRRNGQPAIVSFGSLRLQSTDALKSCPHCRSRQPDTRRYSKPRQPVGACTPVGAVSFLRIVPSVPLLRTGFLDLVLAGNALLYRSPARSARSALQDYTICSAAVIL